MVKPFVLLDTNICVYALLGLSEPLRERMGEQDEGTLAVSTVTLAELSVGRRTRKEQEERLSRFLTSMQVLPFDEAAARRYGDLPFRRGAFDRLLAAHALALGIALITNNESDFIDVPGLAVENWTL